MKSLCCVHNAPRLPDDAATKETYSRWEFRRWESRALHLMSALCALTFLASMYWIAWRDRLTKRESLKDSGVRSYVDGVAAVGCTVSGAHLLSEISRICGSATSGWHHGSWKRWALLRLFGLVLMPLTILFVSTGVQLLIVLDKAARFSHFKGTCDKNSTALLTDSCATVFNGGDTSGVIGIARWSEKLSGSQLTVLGSFSLLVVLFNTFLQIVVNLRTNLQLGLALVFGTANCVVVLIPLALLMASEIKTAATLLGVLFAVAGILVFWLLAVLLPICVLVLPQRRAHEKEFLAQSQLAATCERYRLPKVVPGLLLLSDEKLGAGGAGQVMKASYSGKTVAVKQLFSSMIDSSDLTELEKEARTLSQLRHPNILRFFGICELGDTVVLVSEFCEIDLFRLLHKKDVPGLLTGWLTANMKIQILQAVVEGIKYLHEQVPPVVHHDLKPENVLMDRVPTRCGQLPQVVLCDFGLCKRMTMTKTKGENKSVMRQPQSIWKGASISLELADVLTTHRQLGTLQYMPPESLSFVDDAENKKKKKLARAASVAKVLEAAGKKRRSIFSHQSPEEKLDRDGKENLSEILPFLRDVFSTGVIILETIYQRRPYEKSSANDVVAAASPRTSRGHHLPIDPFLHVENKGTELMVAKHGFAPAASKILDKLAMRCLARDPSSRPSVEEVSAELKGAFQAQEDSDSRVVRKRKSAEIRRKVVTKDDDDDGGGDSERGRGAAVRPSMKKRRSTIAVMARGGGAARQA